MDTSGFRPSTNIEDNRDKPLWQQGMEAFGVGLNDLKHPLTPRYQTPDLVFPNPDISTSFGLPSVADALAANPPSSQSTGPTDDELRVRLGESQSYPFVNITPVDRDPFAVQLMSVDYNPF